MYIQNWFSAIKDHQLAESSVDGPGRKRKFLKMPLSLQDLNRSADSGSD